MRPFTQQILGFSAAGIVTAAAWITLWPRPVPASSPSLAARQTVGAEARWSRERTGSLITAVENSTSDEAKLNACTDLFQIPAADARESLDQANLKNGHRLSLVAKILLIRWAASDGEAALQWAWKRFRSEGLWGEAFREIAPAWAAHNPASIGKWALSAADELKPQEEELAMATIEAMEQPPVDSEMLTRIAGWLITEEPRLAYQVLKRRGGFSSEDMKMPLALTSVAKIQEALSVFGLQRINDPLKLSGDEVHLYHLLSRWRELDPDDFHRSPHAGSLVVNAEETAAAIGRWRLLPAAERARNASSLISNDNPETGGWRISAIAQAWAETDPDGAIRWLDSLPRGNESPANAARIAVLAALDLDAALDRADQLPAGPQRQNSLVLAFDAWTKAYPGETADRTSWPAERQQAWRDLEALQPPPGS